MTDTNVTATLSLVYPSGEMVGEDAMEEAQRDAFNMQDGIVTLSDGAQEMLIGDPVLYLIENLCLAVPEALQSGDQTGYMAFSNDEVFEINRADGQISFSSIYRPPVAFAEGPLLSALSDVVARYLKRADVLWPDLPEDTRDNIAERLAKLT
jgi:hypothetical protein